MRPILNDDGHAQEPENHIAKLALFLRHLPAGDAIASSLLKLVQYELLQAAEADAGTAVGVPENHIPLNLY